MPAFFTAHFWNFAEPEFWVGIGLFLFLAVVVFVGVPKMIAGQLDAKSAKIQAELDEAARLRAEADARVMESDAKVKLEETLARRQALAERRIAQAEAQATADVRAAAADLAARAAEQILTARVAGQKSDPLLEPAIAQIATRLN